uniref:CCHC-type domain-containing protein n=1 Tax=Ananas comosus var. bracteatus TaxID=296719 RepID=A0A6V7PYD2_ANACO|nr:unnamed protein product [Ananas comosus var. bracteatus]
MALRSSLRPPPCPLPSTSPSRGGFSFKDALLTPLPCRLPSLSFQRARRPISSLPPLLPKYLLNPSLKGRCFRCFEKGHRATQCREPRRCLLCMRIGHPASRCKFPSSSSRRKIKAGPSSGQPSSVAAFLPSRPPPHGLPSLSSCVALAEVLSPFAENAKEVLSQGLAARFEGSNLEYPLWRSSSPTGSPENRPFVGAPSGLRAWISKSPTELDRGHLRHKDVKAAVSGFGELWDIDQLSEGRIDVSFFRVNIRCQDVNSISETLNLMVEDRRFRIPIEIESWEKANPILLGEDMDERLGLESTEAQDRFIRQTGFNSIPARGAQAWPSGPRDHAGSDRRRSSSEIHLSSGDDWPVVGGNSNSKPSELAPLLRCLRPASPGADSDWTVGKALIPSEIIPPTSRCSAASSHAPSHI